MIKRINLSISEVEAKSFRIPKTFEAEGTNNSKSAAERMVRKKLERFRVKYNIVLLIKRASFFEHCGFKKRKCRKN